MKSSYRVNIVVAHGLEAKPILPMFGLEKRPDDGEFPIYSNDEGIRLVLSGMGRKAARRAVDFLIEMDGLDDETAQVSGWLNIGIAGHRSFGIGDGLLINKITEQASGDTFYPGTLLTGYKTAPLITVDEIERHYDEDGVYEMEASGFYRAAQAVSSSEFVHAYKIISDNRDNHVDHIDLKEIPGLIRAQENEILKLIKDIAAIVENHNCGLRLQREYYELKSEFRFSVTQSIQFKKLCQRFNAQAKNERLREIASGDYHSVKQLLSIMEDALD